MMKMVFHLLLISCLFWGCGQKHSTEQGDILIQVNNRSLSRTEIEAVLPKRLSTADSLIWAESYIKQWVKDGLVYDVALRNLSDRDRAEIDQFVDAYRRSLIRYRYQEQLVRERLSANITEADKRAFYEANRQEFLLDHSLIKGLFLKIPVDAPNLTEVKKWYRSNSEASIEKIEKYSVQNATVYEYFYDKWISFDEVMANIPMKVTQDERTFLQAHTYLEAVDSSFCYLLNIAEYIPMGEVAPFEYASTQVSDLLINQRKVEFLREFEEELYNDAVQGGDVVFGAAERTGTVK